VEGSAEAMNQKPHVLIPTAQRSHANEALQKWRAAGYTVAVFVDPGPLTVSAFDWMIQAPYPGVWRAWNALARAAIAMGADTCFLVGDDMDPPREYSADEIRAQYLERFPDGMGVMQGTGDRQGGLIAGKWASQRICGSPFVGRAWIQQAYLGNGPVDGRYEAFYADESLLHVAQRLGVLWQREDVTIFHRHWSFGALPRQDYHLRNDRNSWSKDKALFEASLAAGFPEGARLV
jgi:hypothetical protein